MLKERYLKPHSYKQMEKFNDQNHTNSKLIQNVFTKLLFYSLTFLSKNIV